MDKEKSDLEEYFRNNTGHLINKWQHYFDVYERHLSRFRGQEITILEIGVSQGGSLQMWRNYFGSEAKIYGIDVDPRCKDFEEENVEIFIGSQSDRKFLQGVVRQIPPIDILIDDGGHTMQQQIISFEELFDKVKPKGVYIVEDLHTSYWLKFGGGHRRRGTFIEYSKNFIDYLNAWHSKQRTLRKNTFTTSVRSLHYYDSMLVIEKDIVSKPYASQTGERIFDSDYRVEEVKEGLKHRVLDFALTTINRVLRQLRLPSIYWGR